MTKLHYRGPIADHRGSMLGGWTACCSGERAVRIRNSGQHTWDPNEVTCDACLKRMRSHVAYWNDPRRTKDAIEFFTFQNGCDPKELGQLLKPPAINCAPLPDADEPIVVGGGW